jgi:uncharacterized protein (DUF2235 family)
MPKRIVLLSDGTGNSSAKAQQTNVWRMFQALDPAHVDQIMMYHDGVGTSTNKYLAMLGGAFGWGLKRNVLELYEFVCRNYQPGDELFVFGFSRGAFTARTIVGLIDQVGLVDYNSVSDLQRNARSAYARYRRTCFQPAGKPWRWLSPVTWVRAVQGAVAAVGSRLFDVKPPPVAQPPESITVRFMGLWDTVGAYGMPVEEFRPMVNFLFWPMFWENLKLSRRVQRCCHALALDDERTTFHPLVFDQRAEEELVTKGAVAAGRLSQVWFVGMHSNVGGGYPEDQLSLEPLDWMMSQARAAGLCFLPHKVDEVVREKSFRARLYDSRDGLGLLYRYSPRVIKTFGNTGNLICPVLHDSVLLRMAFGDDTYSPLPVPPHFHVLGADGSLVSPHGPASASQQPNGQPQTLAPGLIPSRMTMLQDAIAAVGTQDQRVMKMAWDTVWWRRLAYFCTMGCVAALAAFLLIFGSVISLADMVIMGLPFSFWIDAFIKAPLLGLLLVVALCVGLYFNQLLKKRIWDRGRLAWHRNLVDRYRNWLRDHARRLQWGGIALLGVLGFWIAAGVYRATNDPGQTGVTPLQFFWIIISVWIAYFAKRTLWRGHSILKCLDVQAPLPLTASLRIARYLRTNTTLVWLYQRWSDRIIPALLGVATLALLFIMLNQAVLAVISISGLYCEDSKSARPLGSTVSVPTSAICGATGFKLKADVTYRITLRDPDGGIFDRTVHTDLGGFDGTSMPHIIGRPMRRWVSERWFTPIARVGSFGIEEYALHPRVPYAPVDPAYHVPDEPETCAGGVRCGRFTPPAQCDVNNWRRLSPTPVERRTLVTTIRPRKAGELFLYVNDDAVPLLPMPGWNFYKNNVGSIDVTVEVAGN